MNKEVVCRGRCAPSIQRRAGGLKYNASIVSWRTEGKNQFTGCAQPMSLKSNRIKFLTANCCGSQCKIPVLGDARAAQRDMDLVRFELVTSSMLFWTFPRRRFSQRLDLAFHTGHWRAFREHARVVPPLFETRPLGRHFWVPLHKGVFPAEAAGGHVAPPPGGASATWPTRAPGQRTTRTQPHTIVETDHDYGQKAEAEDCARR
jgi:hypothetical protein